MYIFLCTYMRIWEFVFVLCVNSPCSQAFVSLKSMQYFTRFAPALLTSLEWCRTWSKYNTVQKVLRAHLFHHPQNTRTFASTTFCLTSNSCCCSVLGTFAKHRQARRYICQRWLCLFRVLHGVLTLEWFC